MRRLENKEINNIKKVELRFEGSRKIKEGAGETRNDEKEEEERERKTKQKRTQNLLFLEGGICLFFRSPKGGGVCGCEEGTL